MKWTCSECGARNDFRYKCSECGAWNTADFVCAECGALNDPRISCQKCGHEFCGYCEIDDEFLNLEDEEYEYGDLVMDQPEEEESIPWC